MKVRNSRIREYSAPAFWAYIYTTERANTRMQVLSVSTNSVKNPRFSTLCMELIDITTTKSMRKSTKPSSLYMPSPYSTSRNLSHIARTYAIWRLISSTIIKSRCFVHSCRYRLYIIISRNNFRNIYRSTCHNIFRNTCHRSQPC